MNWIKNLFRKNAQRQCVISDVVCNASIEKKPNPYELIWYRRGWSNTRIVKNNAKYWEFEMEHNGLTIP